MEILLTNETRYQAFIEKSAAQRSMEAASYSASDDVPPLEVIGGNAIIRVCGPLTYRTDFWTWLFGGCSYEMLNEQIAMAEASPSVDRLVYVFDTPGGEVIGILETSDNIYNCKKPTIAVIDHECASAGLWLASQCDSITSVRSGMCGSLGVQAVTRSYAKYLADAGIDVRIFRASISPDKNLGHPQEPRSEKADAEMQTRVDRWGDRFVAAVARGRNVTTEYVVEKFGKGKMFEADEALSIGLIDSIGTVQSVLSEKRSATASGVSYRRAVV